MWGRQLGDHMLIPVLVTNKKNEPSGSIDESSQKSNEKNHASFMLAIYNVA